MAVDVSKQAVLDVVIATCGTDGLQRVAAHVHPRVSGVNYLITCQSAPGEIPPEISGREDFTIEFIDGRGLAANRNAGISKAQAPFVLIADDDVDYSEAGLEILVQGLMKTGDWDIMSLRVDGVGSGYPADGEILRNKFAGRHHPASVEILLNCNRVKDMGLQFEECMGLGAPLLQCGEEDVYIADALMRGARIVHRGITIGDHMGLSSYLRSNGDGFWRGRGAVLYVESPRTWLLRALRLSVVNFKRRPDALWKLLEGVREIKKHRKKRIKNKIRSK